MEVVGSQLRIPTEIELALFRITQEALRNVKKHSQADMVVVRVIWNKNEVKLSFIDNGCGFTLPKGWGNLAHHGKLGLVGMKERARLIGANLSIVPENNTGIKVEVTVPIS